MDTGTIQAITWGIPILVGSIGATFALTKYSNANNLKVLEDRIKLKDDKINGITERFYDTDHSNKGFCKQNPLNAESNKLSDEDIGNITKQIDMLESERDRLLFELSSRTTASLDPRSELSNLLSQLNSTNEEARDNAITGLFALKDPLSFMPIVNYLEVYINKTKIGSTMYLRQCFEALIEIGGQKAVEYVASKTESIDMDLAEIAFTSLRYDLSSPELIDSAIPTLEKCALTHQSSVTRTHAKVLLQHLHKKRQELVDKNAADKKTAKLIERLENKEELERIPNNLILISALKDNDLNELAHKVIQTGQELSYWNIGMIIAGEYVKNETNKNKCIRAIKQIVDDGQSHIAKSSHCLLLYFLSQMVDANGDHKASNAYLDEANKLIPDLIAFFNEHKSAFQIETFGTQ